jgi:glucose-6-phosphate 1-dehydrogenase
MRNQHIQFKKDENFGKKYEDLLLEYFLKEKTHGEDIKKTKNKWNVVDYINDEWVCELKSRRYSIHSFNSLNDR